MAEEVGAGLDQKARIDRGSQERSRAFDGIGVRVFPWEEMWLAVSGPAKVEVVREKKLDELRTGETLVDLIGERDSLREPHRVSDRSQVQRDVARAEELDRRIEALRERGVTQTGVSGERLVGMEGGRTLSFQLNGNVFGEFMQFPVFEDQLRQELRAGVHPGEFNFFHKRYVDVDHGLTLVVFNTGETQFLVRGQEGLPPLTLAIALVQAAFGQSGKELAQYKVSPQQVIEAARTLLNVREFQDFLTTKTTKVGEIFKRKVSVVDMAACQDKANRGQLATLFGTAKAQLMGVASGSGLLI